jgi:CRP-like cAMP-binding protein
MADKPRQTTNRLLTSLPVREQEHLVTHLEPIHFGRKRILYEAGQAMHDAYFFESGMASLLAVAGDGQTVHLAIVGRDGFAGVPIILRAAKTPVRIVTQTPVEAVKIDAQQLLNEFNRRGQLREVLLRYSQVLQIQIAQTALCNSLHTIKQRLCRWLLLCKDSTDSKTFAFTQEDLANMLGSHRNQVSFVARYLAKRRLIQYSRGQIILLDQKKLEQETCDCYRTIRQWTDELL